MKVLPGRTGVVALATLLAPISWGSTYWVITELLPADRPFLIAALRVLPAGLLLAGFGIVASGWRPRGQEWRHTAILALFNFGLFLPLLVAATYRLPGGVVASLGGLQPLLVAAITWVIRGEAPRRIDLAIGMTAAVGVAFVVVRPDARVDALGIAYAIGANLSFAIGVVLTKALPAPRKRLAATGWQLLLSALIIVPLVAVVEGAPPAVTDSNLAGFAYLSLVATGVAGALWFNGIEKLPVQAPPLLGLASAVTGVTLGWLLLSQSLALPQIVGFVITISAITYGATLEQTVRRGDAHPVHGHRARLIPNRRGSASQLPLLIPPKLVQALDATRTVASRHHDGLGQNGPLSGRTRGGVPSGEALSEWKTASPSAPTVSVMTVMTAPSQPRAEMAASGGVVSERVTPFRAGSQRVICPDAVPGSIREQRGRRGGVARRALGARER